MQTTELIYGRTGQVCEVYFPECGHLRLGGIPSSVTCSVYQGDLSNDDTVEFSPSCTVDSVSTTVDVASGYSGASGRKVVSLAATTSIATGRLYLLENTLGQREVVEVTKITSADSVGVLSDLQYEYAITTSTFKGLRTTFTVDATWVATEDRILGPADPSYRARWTYTVGGVVYNLQTYIRLVRKAFQHTLTSQDLLASWPELFSKAPRDQRGEQFQRMLQSAEDRVRADILAEGLKPNQFNDTEINDRLVLLAFEYEMGRKVAAPGNRDQQTFIDEARREYGELFTKHVTTMKVPIDTGVEGATDTAPPAQNFFRR